MKIGCDEEYIELDELERCPQGAPGAGDVSLRVKLKLQDFQGLYAGVWLEASAISEFISALDALEISRQGSARITSMSPDEFTLEIRSSDNLGHMEIEVQLHRYQYSGPTYWPIFLRGGFEVQPEAIKELLSCFGAWMTPLRNVVN